MSSLYVNSTQLRMAAELIAGAEPSVVNGLTDERPGWLSEGPGNTVALTIGILPSTEHLILRDGTVVQPRERQRASNPGSVVPSLRDPAVEERT